MDPQNEEWLKTLLAPLQAESSEIFVHHVMRRVRAYGEETIRWAGFLRWAWPAFALSFMSFTGALVYTAEPVHVSAEALLLEDHDQTVANEMAEPANEDQILDAVVHP